MTNARFTTKSPLAVARQALDVARGSIPTYSSKFSQHRYTQHQLYAVLALRDFLKVDYRGLEQILAEWSELREALGLRRVPDHSTIQRAADRLLDRRGPEPTPAGSIRAAEARQETVTVRPEAPADPAVPLEFAFAD